MTTYLDPVNGSRISQAYAEAMSSAPITRVMVATYEFRHPNFLEGGVVTPIRVVNDFTNIRAKLESAAPVGADTFVEFTAMPVSVNGPEEGDTSSVPSLSINVDGVSGHIAEQLDEALLSATPVEVTERIYASDDLTAPARMPPITMILRTINVTDVTVSAQASFYDPANNAFPRKEYTLAEHPGLSI